MKFFLKNAHKAITYIGGGLTLVTFAQGIQQSKQNKTIIVAPPNLNKRVEMQNQVINKCGSARIFN
jgi:hypothetical protein